MSMLMAREDVKEARGLAPMLSLLGSWGSIDGSSWGWMRQWDSSGALRLDDELVRPREGDALDIERLMGFSGEGPPSCSVAELRVAGLLSEAVAVHPVHFGTTRVHSGANNMYKKCRTLSQPVAGLQQAWTFQATRDVARGRQLLLSCCRLALIAPRRMVAVADKGSTAWQRLCKHVYVRSARQRTHNDTWHRSICADVASHLSGTLLACPSSSCFEGNGMRESTSMRDCDDPSAFMLRAARDDFLTARLRAPRVQRTRPPKALHSY
jgi:hypothetical protein